MGLEAHGIEAARAVRAPGRRSGPALDERVGGVSEDHKARIYTRFSAKSQAPNVELLFGVGFLAVILSAAKNLARKPSKAPCMPETT